MIERQGLRALVTGIVSLIAGIVIVIVMFAWMVLDAMPTAGQ